MDAVAIVGVGAILPDAPDAATFWENLTSGRYSISEVSPHRWDPALYWDPDPKAPDKSYSKIGGWVRSWSWDPLGWKLPVPPKVAEAMDDAQKWAVAVTRAVLEDHGRPIDRERTAVIIGNAMAGEKHYATNLRISYPEIARELTGTPTYQMLPAEVQAALTEELGVRMSLDYPEITEDTMPGELGNVMAGRVANLFDLHGPNFIVDAACASAMAAIDAAMEGLVEREFDAVIAGGVDRNMGASSYVKFCKIGALSATGTRPFDAGADGFVMGEGAALFLLKRLDDAERDGDRVYAVLRGIAGASDGRGKGITAPNPVGQRLALERAWRNAGISPATCSMVEAHGTSTRVGDVVEVTSLSEAFAGADLAPGSVALGSVKSNIGHLKAAAGAAGLLKAVLSLHHGVIPPSLGFRDPNPNVDWAASPFRVNTELREWEVPKGSVRAAGVSAFGFGGTNFHMVLEEHVPGRIRSEGARQFAVGAPSSTEQPTGSAPAAAVRVPLRGALVVGAADVATLAARLREVAAEAAAGRAPDRQAPASADLRAEHRVAIDYGDAAELADRAQRAVQTLDGGDDAAAWRILRGRGVFRGRGPAPKVAFLYTGQGSQYVNMLARLRTIEPIVQQAFDRADAVMTPLLGRPLTSYLFVDGDDAAAVAAAEADLRNTEITQPAVLATDLALTELLAAYGIRPDMVMGHSLGEYGALVAAGALTFEAALEAVSARGREMANLSVDDRGAMAAVLAPLEEIQALVASIDGYVVVANVNSTSQAVIGGATAAVEAALEECRAKGWHTARLPVSHAFHTSIVAPASEPLRQALQRLGLRSPVLPVVSNVTGRFYPMGDDVVPQMLDLLAAQVASPVQFVDGLGSLYDAGARVTVEVGPKRALQGLASDVLGDDDVLNLSTNHPKHPDEVAVNQALCGLYAAGLGAARDAAAASPSPVAPTVTPAAAPVAGGTRVEALRHLFDDFLQHSRELYGEDDVRATTEPVVISGAALGLPGTDRLFHDDNVARILRGEQLIDAIPLHLRQEMLDKHITRLVKSEERGASFETIDSQADVIKLAARAGELDLAAEFGVEPERVAALGRTTQLAIAAGIDALRDAGIPLVLRYRTSSIGTRLPDRWGLADSLRDETGVIFASAFPGLDELVDEVTRYEVDRARRAELDELRAVRDRVADADAQSAALVEIDRRIHDVVRELEQHPYEFDRRFLFRVLSMGHSQLAELIGARGPNTQLNSACSSTTQAIALAQDWIRVGRCRRVVVVAADDATSDHLLGWIGAGFLASGAAATDDDVTEAAVPFDRRRHGMILGMGAAALVVESAEAARERGVQPICEVLGAVTANSAFHGTRLDVEHIEGVMEDVVRQAERRGVDRHAIASETVFVSHETYTPARGGSASAEVAALRSTFGASADRLVIANTKGLTGHPMGVGIEDVVAVKALETGIVPPVPNHQQDDPDLGPLHLSAGGAYPVRYALRLAAGFGSQISMVLLRWTPVPDGRRRAPDELGYAYRIVDPDAWAHWLRVVSGQDAPRLEVVDRRLRVIDGPAAARPVEPRPAAARTAVAPVIPAPEPAQVATAPAPVAAPKPAPKPVPEPVPAPVAVAGDDGVEATVLELVAVATGYPPEMLDLDLDLEADLGIDTVKQAELFAAVRERYGIERDDRLKLRDYPTLAHVLGFVRERAGLPEPSVAAPASAPAPEPVPEPVAGDDGVEATVLELVAVATGYPPEMLDLDLDLEADLGIDTVKQAELFAAVRERYGIERDDRLKLRDYPTLAHVLGFVRERAGIPEPSAAPEPAPVAPEAVEEPASAGFPRRVPVAVVRPPFEWCEPTGVELVAGCRVVVVPDEGGVADAVAELLAERGVEVVTVARSTVPDDVPAMVEGWRAAGPVTGLFALAGLDAEPALDQLDPADWYGGLGVRVKLVAALARELHPELDAGRFLVSATRLGGRFGYDDEGAAGAMGGAVSGLTKALARERPAALVKVVDTELDADADAVASALLAEVERDPGAVEVGHAHGRRWTLGLRQVDAGRDPARALGPDATLVVTGAAGSIVAAITADLAAASRATFHLLDLTPEPARDDPDLARFVADHDGLKAELASRITARGERATPVLVERELARIERSRAALDAIEAVERAGGRAVWYQVDLTDADAVAAVMASVLEQGGGSVDVLVHAAGLEISHVLPDKPQREYDLVFDVKANGWYHLLRGLGGSPLGAAVVFSSIAGRFGNGGQTDYSAANDLLCKSVSSLPRWRPGTRGIAIDWTAWAGIGMASRGSIPKMMALAGIEMLPAAEGIPVVRHEVEAAGDGREVVVAGSLGVLADERHPTGGLAPRPVGDRGPMTGEVRRATAAEGLVVVTVLDPATQPFLDHHRIDGTPVLPGVMGIEAFCEAASLLAPDLQVVAVEGVSFLAPCKWYRDEPRPIEVVARLVPDGDDLVAECELRSTRVLAGDAEQTTVHFTGRVRLAASGVMAPTAAVPGPAPDGAVGADDVYRVYFHGPAYQVVEQAWRAGASVVGRLADPLPANHRPPELALRTEPRLLELCFQTAGLHELGIEGRMALPERVERVELFEGWSGEVPVHAVAEPGDDGVSAVVVDGRGAVRLRLTGYRTIAVPGGVDPAALEPLRRAMA